MNCAWCGTDLDPLEAKHLVGPNSPVVSFCGYLCGRYWFMRQHLTPAEMKRQFPAHGRYKNLTHR